jgi:Ca-activated chloride channel family protein
MIVPDFHFLRPEWFIALFPIVVAFLIQKRRAALSGQWKNIVAPALQPYMLKHDQADKDLSLLKYVFLLAAILAVIALAGPSWKKQPSQVFNSQAGLVIALDLSLSMTAQDVSPSRLQRAKYKILDVLDQNIGNNIALIAYAGDAHVASPLTRDIKTIQSMLPALDPYIMPAQGSNIRSLVDETIKLFEQGKSSPKTLLLVSDGAEESDINYAANALKVAGIHLSILAVGTNQGAPLVKPDGQFFKDSNGQVIMPQLEWDELKSLSDKTNGRIRMLSSNDSDIKYLTETQTLKQGFEQTEESVVFDQWFDSGYWLLLPIILLALLGFRKGVLLAVCLMVFHPNNSWAEDFQTSSLPDLLLNNNQAAMKKFKDNPAAAAEQFKDSNWKASSLYKAQNYQAALDEWQSSASGQGFNAENLYNQANALAHLNRLDEALAAFDKVLDNNPDHEDAKFNKQKVENMIKQQDSQSDSSKQSDDSKDSQKQDGEQQDGQQQDGQKQEGQNKDGEQSEAKQDQQSDNPANQQGENGKEENNEQQKAESKDSENPNDPANDEKNVQQQQNKQATESGKEQQDEFLSDAEIAKNAEQEQAMQQWMERIPDDPGGLLRNKFLYQYKNRNRNEENGDRKPW